MAERLPNVGKCKLTGKVGPYVKSHLIPAALTKRDRSGQPFIQAGVGFRPQRRWSSWYDSELVTKKGEDILASYDNWAITELRRLELVWSGWKADESGLSDHSKIPGTPWEIRKVITRNPAKLRLFFLSLLWRAAATRRWEFGEIYLPEEHLEQLRLMVLNGNPNPTSFYPAQLTQLSTKGDVQSQTPFVGEKQIYDDSGKGHLTIPFFRFYMDGLIAHITKQASDSGKTEELGSQIVGNMPDIVVSTIQYEKSFQHTNLNMIISEAYSRPKR